MSDKVNYRYTVDELVDNLRDYIDQNVGELAEHMQREVGAAPEFAERLQGYKDAIEDVQKMLRDPTHLFHRRLGLYINYARQENRHAQSK